MTFIKEFKEFTLRGNVIDLAVGIVIGAAFAAIVASVVEHIFMPLIGIITGGIDFSALAVSVGDAELKYGMFLQAVITFIIIAFFLFLVVRAANQVRVKPPAEPPPPSSTDLLLMKMTEELVEIRKSLLAKQNGSKITETKI